LDNPQDTHPAVHVAGTSGKGSVCYLIDEILRAHGKHTGLMVSPHVYDIRERIQFDGVLIPERQFAKLFYEVLERTKSESPSYFNMLTAMGFLALSRKKLDYSVVEVGFGGLWDTTNVMQPKNKVCVITQIGLDHTAILGNDIVKIARHKAGIIQPGNIVIALRQDAAVNDVIEDRCNEINARLVWVDKKPHYQQTNDALALAAVNALADRDGWKVDEITVKNSLETIFIPGRFEKRTYKNNVLILDGAHNPQKISALVEQLSFENISPVTFIVAIGERKDHLDMLKILQPVAKRIIATEFFTAQQDVPKRPIGAEQLAKSARNLGVEAQSHRYPRDALAEAGKYPEPIVATGSFYLLSEIDSAM
jgi:dihydrofolate synthase/folylpolyglutamate synthase